MCGLCGILGESEHWTDHPDGGTQRRRERLERAALVGRVMQHFGLKVEDWQGRSFLLSTPTGRTEIVDTLSALWPAAAKLANRRLDPLDPALIAALERLGPRV
jgi:hypothetical protein